LKYLKLYEDLHQPSTAKKKLRLVQLGLADSGLRVLSVAIHWESLDDFADTKHKDHYVAQGPLFTLYDYDNWPVSDNHDGWQESINDIWSDWKEWFGQEGDSDEIFDHLIREASAGKYDLLHLREEGQFYDPYTRELVGTGSMQKPKLNESVEHATQATSIEDAIEKFNRWKRLDRLGLTGRINLVQIETQSEPTDPDLGFPAHTNDAKFREFKKFVKRFGAIQSNSYAGRSIQSKPYAGKSTDDQTISSRLWHMPEWSAQVFSNLPELAMSGISPIKAYPYQADQIWYPWLREVIDEEPINESTSINQKLRLFRLGLMDPTGFEINALSVAIDGPISQLRKGRLKYLTVLKGMYNEIKERAKELGVYLTMFMPYSLHYVDPVNQVQFSCRGPVESLAILEPEIKAKLSELNRNNEINIKVELIYKNRRQQPTTVFSNWVEWAEANLSNL